ncbi:MAG: Ig-like domain-containing protein [Lachnospiraceae bacterium]|nr:Ig-like domain-containing protein [Lachnospiraceae bacterium]
MMKMRMGKRLLAWVLALVMLVTVVPDVRLWAETEGGDVTVGNEASGNEASGNETSGNETSGNEISGNEVSGNITKISKVSITNIDVPVGEENFDNCADVTTTPENGTANTVEVKWTIKAEDNVRTTAAYGTTYTASVTLETNENYVFEEEIDLEVKWTTGQEVVNLDITKEERKVIIEWIYTTEEKKETKIFKVSITNIDVPAGEKKFDNCADVTTTPENGTANTVEVKWTTKAGEDVKNPATYGTTYTASVTLKANEGYVFEENINLDVKWTTGQEVENIDIKKEERTITIKWTYTTEIMPVAEISSVSISGLEMPKGGIALDTDVFSNANGVSSTTIAWANVVSGTADYNSTYTANITVTAKSGYEFATGVSITLNGTPISSYDNQSGKITFKYTYTTPKAQLLSITPPANLTASHGTAKTAEALGLPSTVPVSVEDNAIQQANVTWDLNNLVSGSYAPDTDGEQTFIVNGSVAIPIEYDINGKSTNVQVTVSVDNVHTWKTEITKERTNKEDGFITTHCQYCHHIEKETVIPRKEIELDWGEKCTLDSLLSSTEGYEKMSISGIDKKLKPYVKIDSGKKTIKVNKTKKSIKKGFNLKITVDGKEYTTKVKITIPKPTKKGIGFKIIRKSVGDMYKYTFKYNIKDKEATRILVTCDALNNKVLKKYITGKKSTSDSYIYCSKKTTKKGKKNKLKFKVKIIYGKNESPAFTCNK